MPRQAYLDTLTNHRFWLFDAAPMDPLAVPVLNPIFGFTSFTAPEISVETHDIQEGNWPFPKKVVLKGSLNTLTLVRGATLADADFWRWIKAAVHGDVEALQTRAFALSTVLAQGVSFSGDRERVSETVRSTLSLAAAALMGLTQTPRIGGPTFRRSLVLMQFFPNLSTGGFSDVGAGIGTFLNAAAVSGPTAAFGGAFGAKLGFEIATALIGAFTDANKTAQAMAYERVTARAWVLDGVIPVRYKTGTDYDASSPAVSLQELDLVYEGIKELSIASG